MTSDVLLSSFLMRLRLMATDQISWFVVLVEPLVAALVISFTLRGAGTPGLPERVLLASAMLSIWSAAIFSSAGSLDYERYIGTVEPVVGSAAPFKTVVLGKCFAGAVFGFIAGALTMAVSCLALGVSMSISRPMWLVLAVCLGIPCIAVLAACAAPVFALFDAADSLANVLVYPVWLLSGAFVALNELPAAASVVGHALPTTWIFSVGARATSIAPPVSPYTSAVAIVVVTVLGYRLLGRALAGLEHRAAHDATLKYTV